MRKGDILEGIIEEYDFPNKGSFMLDDRKVTIKGAFIGQKVRFMVTKKKSGRAEGRLLEVLEKAPFEDANPSCKHFGICGGCMYQTMSYKNQLDLKEDMVKKLLDSAIEDYQWEGMLSADINEGYRNKMEFSFGDEYKGGPLALGLHKKGSMHDIVPICNCSIINNDWNEIVKLFQEFFTEKGIEFYHKFDHSGILRHLVIRQSYASKEFLINLVTSTQYDENFFKVILDELTKRLLDLPLEGTIGGFLHTKNDSMSDVVKSDETILLYGKDFIVEEVMGLKFKISPFSFFQTNTKGCEVLYKKARDYINDIDGKVVFDLYSGTGTIAQMVSEVSKKVIGVEIVEEAVEAAKVNASLNGIENCEFIAGDVLQVIDQIEEKPDMIILDPPRDGIHPKALPKIISYGVNEIVYISCKPTSLIRDLVIFKENGYKVVKACGVDQFPGTGHVESVVLITRKDR